MDEATANANLIDPGSNLHEISMRRSAARSGGDDAGDSDLQNAARLLAERRHQKMLQNSQVVPDEQPGTRYLEAQGIRQELEPQEIPDGDVPEGEQAVEAEEEPEVTAEPTQDEDTEEQGFVDLVSHRTSDGTELAMPEAAAVYVSELERKVATQAAAPIPAEMQQALAHSQQTLAHLGQVVQALDSLQPPSTDMLDETSDAYNPSAYRHQQAVYEQARQERDVANRQQMALAQQFEAQQQQILGQKWPDYVDPVKGPQVRQEAKAMLLQEYGFQEQELNNVRDHRFALLARDALAYRKLQSGIPEARKKVRGKPRKVVRPGTSVDPLVRSSQALQRATEAARQTGSVDDVFNARQLRRQSVNGGEHNL